MEELNQKTIDRAVLVGLNADCFTKEETATETTLDALEALLKTAGGECAGKQDRQEHISAFFHFLTPSRNRWKSP